MKRDREYDEEDDDVLRRPKRFQELGSEPEDDIVGSQEFSAEGPGSPFAFNFEFQPPSPTDPESLSDVESISGSQPLSQPGSPLTEYDVAIVQRQLDEFLSSQRMMEFERALIAPLPDYPDAFKNQDEPAIETVLGSLGSFEPVTTSSPEPLEQDRVLPVVEKETREKMREEVREEIRAEPRVKLDEVEEMEEAAEVELDAETAIYISQTAEQIFDDALIEFIDGAIQGAMQEVTEPGISAQAVRMEILYDPEAKGHFDRTRSESLEDLKAEIWHLLQQEDMVEG
jgi:hypothetical protein